MMARVLIVDDEARIAMEMDTPLRKAGWLSAARTLFVVSGLWSQQLARVHSGCAARAVAFRIRSINSYREADSSVAGHECSQRSKLVSRSSQPEEI